MKYKVEQLYAYGWDDLPTADDGNPVRYSTKKEATTEIADFIKQTLKYFEYPYDKKDFRVVKIEN